MLQKYNDFYYRENLDVNEIYKAQEHFYDVAKKFCDYLATLITVKSVVEFGCGAGTWLKAFKDTFDNIKVLGMDTSDVDRRACLTENEFKRVNFEEFKWDEKDKFDLAISIEVAEHLEEKYADSFIDSMCASSDCILFSAAVMYQGGDHHVNEQFPSYWVNKFKQRGFYCIDCLRPTFWDDKIIDMIYKENMFLFAKEKKYNEIIKKLSLTIGFMDWIHPDLYRIKMEQAINGTLK